MDAVCIAISCFAAVLIVLLPWWAAWRVFVAFAVGACVVIQWWPRVSNASLGYSMSMLLVAFVFLVFCCVFVVRAIVHIAWTVWRRRTGREARNPCPQKVHVANLVLATEIGIVAGIQIFVFAGWTFNSGRFGFATHALVALVSFALAWKIKQWMRHARKNAAYDAAAYLLRGGYSVMLGLCLFSALGAAYPWYVVARADAIAQGSPYCINLEKRRRPLVAMEDLTFFTMDKRRMPHHAILIIGRGGQPDVYHWSYRLGNFRHRHHHSHLPCDVGEQFAHHLAWFSPVDTNLERLVHPPSVYPRRLSNHGLRR